MRPAVRFAGVIAIVIALHVGVLRWLSSALDDPAHLTAMVAPMFTRLLQPEQPPPQHARVPHAARVGRRGTMAAVAPRVARPAAKPASSAASEAAVQVAKSTPGSATQAPAEAASAAASVAQGDASAPQAEASAPQAEASAPAPAASAAAKSDATAGVDAWPADTRLSYRLAGWYRGALTGSARVQWLRQKDRYETRVDLDLGLIGFQFLSQGDVAGDSLAPRAYQESTPSHTRVVHLGPDNVVLNDGRSVSKPMGVQDTASQFVELSHRFSTGREKLVVGGTTGVWLARPGGVDFWTYDIVSLDALYSRELGTIEAFHLKPRPIQDSRGNIYAEIWLAPSLQYLPVRIRITQPPDSYVDIMVDKIEQR